MNGMHPGSVFLMNYLKKILLLSRRHGITRTAGSGREEWKTASVFFSFFSPTSCLRALRCLIKNWLSQALSKCGDALPLLSSAVRPRRRDKTSVIWRGNRSGDQYSGALWENYCINPPNRGVRSSFSRYRRYWTLHLVWWNYQEEKKNKPPPHCSANKTRHFGPLINWALVGGTMSERLHN